MGRTTAAAALLAAAAAAALPGPAARGGGPARPPGPPPRVFAFVSDLGGRELDRLDAVGDRIDVVAPNWYALDAGGALRGPSRPGPLLAAAARHRVAVWPVVNWRTGGSAAWSAGEVRDRALAALATAATSPGAGGVTVDIEELRPAQRGAFTALVRDAAARVHALGRRIAVYVPRPGPGGARAYDWAALAGAADLLLASGYGEHWSRSAPGPVTTAAGWSSVVATALRAAGPSRAVPVAGAFGFRWRPGRPGTLISSVDAERLARGRGPRRADGTARLALGAEQVAWQTGAGLRARARAARAGGARWLGLFSLGREPMAFWRGLATDRRPDAASTNTPETGMSTG